MQHLRRIELCVTDHGDVDLAAVRRVFPTVAIERTGVITGAITAEQWRAEPFDFWAFDRELDARVDAGAPLRIAAAAADAAAVTREILTRAQRRIARQTVGAPWFARILAIHRARHDLSKPLVRADLDHALDAWQWSLRIDADAPAAVQLATLLHDLERLATEADARVEHHAADYQAFKDAHARAGARMAHALLVEAGVDGALADEVARLVAVHERASDEPALRAINDADALSFFSLNSAGYAAYFGPAQTAKKVAYTLARMSAAARAELPAIRVPREVRGWIEAHDDQRA